MLGKVVTVDRYVVTTDKVYKTRDAIFVTSHRTKASTFAICAKATRKAKIAKELAF